MRFLHALNGFFFDVEDDEAPMDIQSMVVFYGACTLMAVASPVYIVLTMVN